MFSRGTRENVTYMVGWLAWNYAAPNGFLVDFLGGQE